MKILILHGSPRRKGNTQLLVEAVIDGIMQHDEHSRIELIHLPQLDIHPCIGCDNCAKEGTCIFPDDMPALYEKIADARRIVLATPIYFYTVTAQTKVFIDRCQTLWSRKYILKQHNPDRARRKGYLISVAATRGERLFEGAVLTTRYAFDAMDCTYAGDLLVPGADSKGAVSNRPDIMQQATRFGHEIASS